MIVSLVREHLTRDAVIPCTLWDHGIKSFAQSGTNNASIVHTKETLFDLREVGARHLQIELLALDVRQWFKATHIHFTWLVVVSTSVMILDKKIMVYIYPNYHKLPIPYHRHKYTLSTFTYRSWDM
jgi:hypothetical protein